METSQPVTAEDIDLTPVFGALDDTARAEVLETLRRGDAALRAAAKELKMSTDGLAVAAYPSGQTEVTGTARGAEGKLTFEAALRPRNFFLEQNPWRPG